MNHPTKMLNETSKYAIMGVLLGLLFPILATVLQIAQSGLPLSLSSAAAVQRNTPLLWIIDTAPLVLSFIAMLAGLRQDRVTKLLQEITVKERELTAERNNLEQHVQERTARLSRKTEQLRSASLIARQTAELQHLDEILDNVAKLVTSQFGFYHTGIFLINETGKDVVLQAASSEGGKRMIEKGHSLTVGAEGIVGHVASQKKTRIALDVGIDPVFFNNPDLPMTRSEVAIPLMTRNKVLGVLDIQSDMPQAFTPEDTDVLETLADQIAIAIENARLLDESQAALMQLEALTSVRTKDTWTQKLNEKSYTYTYTPLGLRAEKPSAPDENTIVIPVKLRGQKIGKISISRKRNTKWNKMDEEWIAEVATQVGLAVENIRLLEEATQQARQEQTVGEISTRFSQALDIDSLLQTAVREMGQLPDISEISVFINQVENEAKSQAPRMKHRAG